MVLADILITNGWIVTIAIVIIIIVLIINSSLTDLHRSITDKTNKITEQQLIFDKREAEIKLRLHEMGMEEFEKFKKTELENQKKIIERDRDKISRGYLN